MSRWIPGEWRTGLAVLWVIIVPLFFLDKPPHIDDANFLILAKGASMDFWRPHAISINWQGTTERAFNVLSNPPGIGWWLAPLGESRDALRHVWMLPWMLLAAWGAARLGDRFGGQPAAAVALVCGSPVALLAAQSLTPDLPLLACTLAGLAGIVAPQAPGGRRWPWAVLAGSAVLFRYSGVAVVPLVALWPLLSGDVRGALRAGLWAALPFAALLLHDLHAYGELHILAMSQFQAVAHEPWEWFRKGVAAIAMLGGACVLPVLAVSRPRVAVAGALVGGALGFLAGLASSHAGLALAWTTVVTAAGGATFGATLRGETRESRFLTIWIVGGLVFLLQLRFTATRYWLPFAAPAVLAVLRSAGPRLRRTAVLLTAGLSLALSVDDADFARQQARLAAQADAATTDVPPDQRWFSGHWGWQHALEARGWRAVEEDQPLSMGAIWATSAASWPQDPAPACFAERDTLTAPRAWPLPRTHTRDGVGNFHAHVISAQPPLEVYAPFGFGADPIDRVRIWQVVPCGSEAPSLPKP